MLVEKRTIMNIVNNNRTSFTALVYVIGLITFSTVHSAQQPQTIMHDVSPYSNEVCIESDVLSRPLFVDFHQTEHCCGKTYVNRVTTQIGSPDRLAEFLTLAANLKGESTISFRNNTITKTFPAQDGSIFKISEQSDAIVITQGKDFKDEGHTEIFRLDLQQ